MFIVVVPLEHNNYYYNYYYYYYVFPSHAPSAPGDTFIVNSCGYCQDVKAIQVVVNKVSSKKNN